MAGKKCAVCSKTAYPIESHKTGDKVFHKACFKCTTCKMTLSLRNFKSEGGVLYCAVHLPKAKATQVADSVSVAHAVSAPKAKSEGLSTVHKGDQRMRREGGDFDYTPPAQEYTPPPVAEPIAYEADQGAVQGADAYEPAAYEEPAYAEPAAAAYEEPAYDAGYAEPAYDESAGYEAGAYDESAGYEAGAYDESAGYEAGAYDESAGYEAGAYDESAGYEAGAYDESAGYGGEEYYDESYQ